MGASTQSTWEYRHHNMSVFHQYEVTGRKVPTEREPNPKAYRLKLFSKNETNAKSRFWYFIRRIVKMKKANGEILQILRSSRSTQRRFPTTVSQSVTIPALTPPTCTRSTVP